MLLTLYSVRPTSPRFLLVHQQQQQKQLVLQLVHNNVFSITTTTTTRIPTIPTQSPAAWKVVGQVGAVSFHFPVILLSHSVTNLLAYSLLLYFYSLSSSTQYNYTIYIYIIYTTSSYSCNSTVVGHRQIAFALTTSCSLNRNRIYPRCFDPGNILKNSTLVYDKYMSDVKINKNLITKFFLQYVHHYQIRLCCWF